MATYKVKAYGKEYIVEVIEQGSGARVIVEGYSFEVEPAAPGSFPTQVTSGPPPTARAGTAAPIAARPVMPPPHAAAPAPAAPPAAPRPATAGGRGAVLAPIPGVVTKVCVAIGEEVKAGQTVVKLEAMKMENDITSLIDGTVKEVAVGEGTEVADGQLLVLVE